MSNSERQRAVVILGSGASEACGMQSTDQLTHSVVTAGTVLESSVRYRAAPVQDSNAWTVNQEVWPLTQLLWEALRGTYSRPNFETYVHALETLEPLAASRRISNWFGDADEYRPVVTAFCDILGRYEPFMRAEILQAERITVTKRLFEALDLGMRGVEARGSGSPLSHAIAKMRMHYSLSALTLNYDDLIDDVLGAFFDGFKVAAADAMRFSASDFIKSCSDASRDLLLHLHGSVRYGYLRSDGMVRPEIVKYASRVQALQSIGDAIASLDAARGDWVHGGVVHPSAPIISGVQKADKLMMSPSPLGYYYHTAITQILEIPRLIVIGYGCRDPHINAWIWEAARLHGESFRLAFVTLLNPNLRGPIGTLEKTTVQRFLSGITNATKWDDRRPVKQLGKTLLVALDGLPLSDDAMDGILSFIAS